MCDDDRYTNEPLLKFKELYVLWAIGEISEEEEQWMVKMTSSIYDLLSGTDVGQSITPRSTWQEMIAAAMGLAGEPPDDIRDVWHGLRELTARHRYVLTLYTSLTCSSTKRLVMTVIADRNGSGIVAPHST